MGVALPRFQSDAWHRDVARLTNPIPYRVTHFKEKLHCDQNEKLARYGVTYVAAVDGFSRKIVGLVIMPVKNAVVIYDKLFRPLIEREGIWDQLRTDHGREFALIGAVQEQLAPENRGCNSTAPFLSTMSTSNHRVERLWPEINCRVSYPIKEILIRMEERAELNLADEVSKSCIYFVVSEVAYCGAARFVDAWNGHRISGSQGDVPNELSQSGNVHPLTYPLAVLTTADV